MLGSFLTPFMGPSANIALPSIGKGKKIAFEEAERKFMEEQSIFI